MKKTISKDIYESLLNKIVDLTYMPGQKISENKIGMEYGVSRTVVRSAFLRLKQVGFVDIYPKSGTFVTKIDFHHVKSALFLRLGVEKEILNRIINDENSKKRLIDKLEEIYALQSEFDDDDDYIKEFAALDMEFHKVIINGYKNHDIVSMVENHLLHISRWRNLMVLNGVTIGMILEEHRQIIDAIIENDMDTLRYTLDKHIDRTIYGAYKDKNSFRSYFK